MKSWPGGKYIFPSVEHTGYRFRHYGIPLIAVAIVFVVKLVLDPLIDLDSPFLLFFAAILVSSWYGGLRAGLLATGLSALLAAYFFLVPFYALEGHTVGQSLRLVLFILEGAFIGILGEVRTYFQAQAYQERQWLQVTLSSIGDAVIVTDEKGQITFLNTVAQSLTGWTEPEAIGSHLDQVFRIIKEETRELSESPVAKVIRLNTVVGLANHTILIAKNGREITIDDSGAPIRSDADTMIGMVLVFRDVSERKQAETRTKILQQLVTAFSDTLTNEQIMKVLMEQELTSALAGTIALFNMEGTELRIASTHHVGADPPERFTTLSLDAQIPISDAVRTGLPIWIENRDTYTTRYPTLAPLSAQALAALPLFIDGHKIGGLEIQFKEPQLFDEPERGFLTALAYHCSQVLERIRLSQEAEDIAVMKERQRLARDMHDSVTQTLFSINLLAQSLPQLWKRQPEQAADQTLQLGILAQAALEEMRILLFELRPASLINAKLSDLFKQLSNAAHARGNMTISTAVAVEPTLPEEVHIALYRIVQESLNNMVKHSGATEGSVTLTREDGHLLLRIRDNGKGFDTQTAYAGLGSGVLRERAAIIGASMEIISAIGNGTEVIVRWTEPKEGLSVFNEK